MTPDLPVLDDTRCVGSAACVAICPTGCLAMAAGRPWMPRPGDCVSCAACVPICPTDALRMAPSSPEK